MYKNTENQYGFIAKLLHWSIAIIIFGLITVGFIMSSMQPSDAKWQLYGMHKATGFIILLLVLFRIFWRIINITVMPPVGIPFWQMIASRLAHYGLYVCMLTMPLSGTFMSLYAEHNIDVFGMFTLQAFEEKNLPLAKILHDIHFTTIWILCALITLHILAALYHHFIRKDNTLLRMIIGK